MALRREGNVDRACVGRRAVDSGMSSRPKDTGPEAWATYRAILDRMDGPARFRVAVELSEAVREIRLAGLRARNPDLSHRQVVARLVAEDYGVDLPPRE